MTECAGSRSFISPRNEPSLTAPAESYNHGDMGCIPAPNTDLSSCWLLIAASIVEEGYWIKFRSSASSRPKGDRTACLLVHAARNGWTRLVGFDMPMAAGQGFRVKRKALASDHGPDGDRSRATYEFKDAETLIDDFSMKWSAYERARNRLQQSSKWRTRRSNDQVQGSNLRSLRRK